MILLKGQISLFDMMEVDESEEDEEDEPSFTIAEFDKKEESWDINKLTEIEMVDIVNRECGLNLKFDKFFEDYRQKLKHGWVIAVEYSNYFADDDDWEIYNDLDGNGARFVDLSIMSSKGGLGMPCDSMEECIKTIKGWIEKQDMR